MDMRDRIKEGLGDKIKDWREHSLKRIYIILDKKDIFEAAQLFFKKLGLRFSTASGVALPQGFEIIYHFSYDKTGEIYSLRVLLDDKLKPALDSITPIFPGAEWVEREMWEMLGIGFTGHPNLKRLLLADDWPEGKYPLRQDYEP